MAGNRIEYDIAVLDKGGTIQGRTNAAKELNKELERTQKLASGTKSGDQAMRRAGYGEYTTAGGVTGRGGASARDFAAEAQGLGGLVRLYATYAANVFAVSAAFTALREAMNTEIMIRGLDQLGAASGIAMGGLAKQFAAASGGAISLRESMEATAKAISSGLTAQQFMQLGEVAKGASQALGVNMSDAVSRLTRGITKLEPELLDELGIFTKTGKAAEDYARSVGKAESQLTDFERRQAFANAVLKEGTDKFGEIAQAGNPYDQLLASLKNVAQDILTVVNTVVGPIAKLLAENTGLITAGIAVMALKITQMALPALSKYSDYLKSSAAQAGQFASVQSERAWASQVKNVEDKLGITASQAREMQLTAEQSILNNQLKTLQQQKATTQDIVNLEARRAAIEAQITKEKQFQTTQYGSKTFTDLMEKEPSVFRGDIHAIMMERVSKSLDKEFLSKTIRAQAVEKTADAGTLAGFGELIKLTGQYGDKLGTVGKMTTIVTGALAVLGQTFLNVTRFLGSFLGAIGIAITVFQVLESLFSTNGKAVREFESAVDGLSEATKTATAVTEKFKGVLSVDSINAYANSFEGVADALEKTTKAFITANQMSSWIDKTKDFLMVFFGGQRSKALGEGLVNSITESIKVTPAGELRDSLEYKLQQALGTSDLSTEGLAKQLNSLTDSLNDKELASIANSVSAILKDSTKALKDAQAVTQDVRETAKASKTSFENLANSVKDNSPITVFLSNTVKQAAAVDKALKDVIGAQGTLNELTQKGNLEFLDPEIARQMSALLDNYKQLNKESDLYNQDIAASNKELKKLDEYLSGTFILAWNRSAAEQRRAAIQDSINAAQEGLAKTREGMESVRQAAQNLIKDSLTKQVEQSLRIFKFQLQQLAVDQQKFVMSKYPIETVEVAKERTKLEIESINIQSQLAEANLKLVMGIELLRIQVQRDADLREIQVVREQAASKETTAAKREELLKRETFLTDRIVRSAKVEQLASAPTGANIDQIQKMVAEDPTLESLVAQLKGIITSRQKFANMRSQAILGGDIRQMEIKTQDTIRRLEEEIKGIEQRIQEVYDTSAQGVAARSELQQQLERKNIALINERATGELQIAKKVFEADKREGAKDRYESIQKEIDIRKKAALEAVTSRQRIQEYNTALEISGKSQGEINQRVIERYDMQISSAKLLADQEQNIADKALDTVKYQQDILTKRKELGLVTDEQYRLEDLRLKLLEAELTLQRSLLRAESDRDIAAKELAKDIAKQDTGGADFLPSPEFLAKGAAIGQAYSQATQGAITLYKQSTNILQLNSEITDSMRKLGDTVEQQFMKMTDAIATFVETGKFSFKDLMKSMLSDFLRTILRMNTQSMLAGVGGGSSIISNVFKSLFGSAMGNVFTKGEMMKYAKGGVLDIPAYAMGGTFTNQIVNKPTFFKAANGLGLMGEAGPEAIMPLKRMSNGRLGVESETNKPVVNFNVHNYSGQEVKTQETTDSRGNVSIDIMVGGMVGREIARPGAAPREAIANSFGLRPTLIRR